MRHIISILLQNEAGALVRVAGMFSARGYNIESLSVAPTDDETVSRLTLVTSGSDEVINQINKQLQKLVDVVDVTDMTRGDHYERELLLAKVDVEAAVLPRLDECGKRYSANVLDDTPDTYTLLVTGTSLEIDDFLNEIGQIGRIVEVVRSGAAAIGRGNRILKLKV
jgi:acetolactate synthase-1/3 small subunit